MKRSEVVDLMWKYVQQVENNYDRYMTKNNVDDLLRLVELAGMKPPPVRLKEFDDEFGSDFLVSRFEWEKE